MIIDKFSLIVCIIDKFLIGDTCPIFPELKVLNCILALKILLKNSANCH